MKTYIGLIHEQGGKFGVSFPDFPGCIGAGDTVSKAIQNAKDGLLLHIEGMLDDELELPTPSEIEDIEMKPGDIVMYFELTATTYSPGFVRVRFYPPKRIPFPGQVFPEDLTGDRSPVGKEPKR